MKTSSISKTPIKLLLEDYTFFLDWEMVVIPQWYAFDGLSIPRPCQWLVDMNETDNLEAGLEHDYCYSLVSWISKKEWDKHLYRAIEKNNGMIRAFLVWLWVYLFWFMAYQKDSNYKKYKKEIIEHKQRILSL